MIHKKRYIDHTLQRACLFSLSLVMAAFLSVGSAAYHTPAFVVGSELNADGSVEYLCLGMGCDALPRFYWAD